MGDPDATRTIRRILVVEDNVPLLSAVCRALATPNRTIEGVTTAAQALEALVAGFDLVLLDVRLPDGSGVTVADAASKLRPSPLVVVLSGESTPQEAFRLAQLGAIDFVDKPFSLDQVMLLVEFVATTRTRLAPIIKACVGNTDLRDVQDGVREVMVEQALAIADGNRTVAARLLRVSRQAIQRFIREGRRVGL